MKEAALGHEQGTDERPPLPYGSYAHAPAQHPQLVLGALQLMVWLLVHPAAWGHHLRWIDPGLAPDFALAQLSLAQWRHPPLRRLLLQCYLVLPLCLAVLVGLLQWLIGAPGHNIVLGVVGCLCIAIIGGFAGSFSVGVAFGLGGSLFGALVVILACNTGTLPTQNLSQILATMPTGRASGVPNADKIAYAIAFAALPSGLFVFGLAGALGLGVVDDLARQQATASPRQQVGSITLAILVCALAYGIGSFLTFVVWKTNLSTVLVNALLYGLSSGLAVSVRAGGWRPGVCWGIAMGLLQMLAFFLSLSVLHGQLGDYPNAALMGLVCGLMLATWVFSAIGLLYNLARRLADHRAGIFAGTIGISAVFTLGSYIVVSVINQGHMVWLVVPVSLAIFLLGLSFHRWRPLLLYPVTAAWNTLLFKADERRSPLKPALLRLHSAFWDQYQRYPLYGLDDHLLMVLERQPAAGSAALTYLSASSQRWATQRVQIELDARKLERCRDLPAISQVHHRLSMGELPGPVSMQMRGFSRISNDCMAALNQHSTYNQRLALSAVEERLERLLGELASTNSPYTARFRPIAIQWHTSIVAYGRQLARDAEERQEINSPYIVGIPLTQEQSIFVGRTEISARIESLLREQGRTPLLLYGQRRMGKTSLLNNLGRMLPSSIVPLFVDLQGPPSLANDHAGLLYNLARGMVASAQQQRQLELPTLPHAMLADDPFTGFDEWLTALERLFGDRVFLLALDEFEALENPFASGRFESSRVLGLLRHIIQHRTRFKMLLSGSHSLEEFQHWASYLINVQMVQISYLSELEARRLIEQPVPDFQLVYTPAASQQVLELTRGHPALLQLLCNEIVALKNDQPPAVRRQARSEDVEAAVSEVFEHGSLFFVDLEHNQLDAAGVALLRRMASHRTPVERSTLQQLAGPDLDAALKRPLDRAILERSGTGYQFQVELIRRWFARQPGPALG